MTAITRTTAAGALALALCLSVTACGASGTEVLAPDPAAGDVAGDGAGGGADAVEVPVDVPAADGPVSTRPPTTGLVVDDGSGAQLCLGRVAESAPPQCSGVSIPLADWSWQHSSGAVRTGGTRYGQYALAGTFDGTTLTVTGAVPAGLYDAAAPQASPMPRRVFADTDVTDVTRQVQQLPGLLGVTPDEEAGTVGADVVFDDGSLQQWADRSFGAGVVTITGALVPSQ